MSDDVDDFLAHYGVKGMRWGVRKAERKLVARQNATGESKKQQVARDLRAQQLAARQAYGRGAGKVRKSAKALREQRMAADPDYQAALKQREAKVKKRRDIVNASIAVGAAFAYVALQAAANLDVEAIAIKSLHDKSYKEWDRSAYGQAKREAATNFVDNTGYTVWEPTYGTDLVRRS